MTTTESNINTVGDPAATNPEKNKFIASVASNSYQGPSIVDYLSLSGQPTDQASRVSLGQQYGISGIEGANNAAGNTALLNALRSGQSSSPEGGLTGGPAETAESGPVETKSKADLAFDSYLSSLKPTTQETEANTYLANLTTQSELAREKALNSGSTLGFAAGEAQRVGRNFDIKLGGQSRLVQAYADLASNRQDISKARYDYEKSKLDAQANNNKGFKLGEGQEQFEYNQTTGKYESVASVASNPNDAAYKNAQIRNLDSQIADRANNQSDESQYTIPSSARNILLGINFNPSEVDQLQEDIRNHGIATVLSWYENTPVHLQLRELINKQGLIYE